MFQGYNEFINEAEEVQPKKPAKYKVGDNLLSIHGKEYRASSYSGKPVDYAGGMILEIEKVEVKSKKWMYTCKIVEGSYYTYSRGRGGSNTVSDYAKIVGFENDFTTEKLKETLDIVSKSKFKKDDEVTAESGIKIYEETSEEPKATTLARAANIKIKSISPRMSLHFGEPCYLFVTGDYASRKFFKESDIKASIKITEDNEDVVAKAIADKFNIDYTKEYSSYKFDALKIDLKDVFATNSELVFDDMKDVQNFYDDIQKVINKYRNELFVKGRGRDAKTAPAPTTMDSYRKVSVDVNKLGEFAQNIGIDLEKLLHDKRGVVKGKGFGI